MQRENEVILLATLQKRTDEEEERLRKLIVLENDWGYIAGQIMHHRLMGYLYYGLDEALRKHVLDPEFLDAIELIVKTNQRIYLERYEYLHTVFQEFEEEKVRYSGLKGLIYGMSIYPIGIRYSGDWDILVSEDDLGKMDKVLRKNGYIQSRDRGFTEASKKDKIIQRMNYHDLVPYYKRIDGGFQEYIKLDINVHFDSKDNDITNEILEYGTILLEKDGMTLRGLDVKTHFLHMCVHFYREATSTLWTEERRDVTLYKIVDVMNTYRTMEEGQIKECCELAKQFNILKQLYFTLYYLNIFYKDEKIESLLGEFEFTETEFLHEIKIDGKNKTKIREENFYDKTFNLKMSKCD